MKEFKLPIENYSSITPGLLDTFKYENFGKDITVKLESDEFGAVDLYVGDDNKLYFL